MTLFDSSLLIDYLDGDVGAIEYVEDNIDHRAIAPPLVLYEVYQGEVFKSGPTDLDAVGGALEWLTVSEATSGCARRAAELQTSLVDEGQVLAARDAYIAGCAIELDSRLAVSDEDFDVAGYPVGLTVDVV